MIHRALALALVLALAIGGCATYHPPSSASWGYRGTMKGGISAVRYASSLAMCQTIREKDMPAVNLADWTAAGISECAPVVITAGTGWFAFSIVGVPENGTALSDATACEIARRQAIARVPLFNHPVGTGSWMATPAYRVTNCSPVAVP